MSQLIANVSLDNFAMITVRYELFQNWLSALEFHPPERIDLRRRADRSIKIKNQ